MQEETLQEVLEVIGHERRAFPYFRGRYALLLLSDFIGNGCRVSDVRRSHLRQLLEKPVVKDFLAGSGSWLTRDRIAGYWPSTDEQYSVTFGQWGDASEYWDRGCDQTCRRGLNLVVQLNFSGRHDALFRTLQSQFGESDYNDSGHPVHKSGLLTLAWARIDFAEDFAEALIEEVQSDWIERATNDLRAYGALRFERAGRSFVNWGRGRLQVREILERYEQELRRHARLWQEAVLAAAIEVIRSEFCCREVYYHTVDSNRHMKDFCKWFAPPRSVYTELPRRFCFEKVRRPPRFLARTADGFARYKLNRCRPAWHRLPLQGSPALSD
ncbi:MAG: hypothetical protein AAF581_04760 [Planctomycetota bacterium]